MREERRINKKWGNLYLVRHGESTANEVNRFAGHVNAPLTALGEAQARRASYAWRGVLPDQVYVSPLDRARRTAEIICGGDSGANPVTTRTTVDGRLSERHFGDFTLENKAHLQRRVGLRAYEAALYGNCPVMHGAENFDKFYDRILDFLRDELHPKLVKGKKVLVVAHKYVIELLARLILRVPVADGYDLRLPNAKILHGADLGAYLRRESRNLNYFQEWIVLHHSIVLLLAAVVGILVCATGFLPSVSPIIAFGLLSMATVISLARITLLDIKLAFADRVFSVRRSLLRYGLFPLSVGAISHLGITSAIGIDDVWVLSLAIVMAAPSAVTALTISRCTGGLIMPTVYMIVISTLVSSVTMLPLLDLYGTHDLAGPAFLIVTLSLMGLFIPLLVARFLRERYPIGTAKFAERNAAFAVLLVALFVVISFQGVELASFWPYGVWAFGFSLVPRLAAFFLSRRSSLYAVDDCVSMSYPNAFVVIVLADLLNANELLQLTTWFLLPMFALAPLDEWLCARGVFKTGDIRLQSFLKVVTPAKATIEPPDGRL